MWVLSMTEKKGKLIEELKELTDRFSPDSRRSYAFKQDVLVLVRKCEEHG